MDKKVIPPRSVEKRSLPLKTIEPKANECLLVSFSKFFLKPVRIEGVFNNHFKDKQHFYSVAASILGIILPKITSHTFTEICEGGVAGSGIHFHSIDKTHMEIVRKVLKEYNYSESTIEQMLEGDNIFQFAGIMGHIYATRITCHKIDNILYFLFLDTNHHIYINEKYVEESLFYEECPDYQEQECKYMPGDCFAFEYLDLEKIRRTYGFNESPL